MPLLPELVFAALLRQPYDSAPTNVRTGSSYKISKLGIRSTLKKLWLEILPAWLYPLQGQ